MMIKITGEIAGTFLKNPTVKSEEVTAYIIDLIELPNYLKKGLYDLDELVK